MAQFPANIDLSSLDGTTGFRISGVAAFDRSGHSVASAGDVNRDGFADLIVGAWGASPHGNNGAGASYVVFGKAGGFADNLDLSSLDGSNGFTISGVAASDRSGFSVASGDVNGDGFADLIVGAYGANPQGAYSGASYVVFGKATGFAANLDLSSLDGSNGFRLSGVAAYDRSGLSVASAGDVNGDGFADLIIGAYRADPHGSDSGASYVVFGKASGSAANIDLSSLDGSNGFRLSGVAANDQSGLSVASAGDVNGDGFADLIVGAPTSPRGSYSGASYVVFGKASGFAANLDLSSLDGSNGFRLSGVAAYDRSGRSVASAGDVNGDGFADLIVGARYADPNNGAGASYVVFGKATGFAANIGLSSLDGSNGFRISGVAELDLSGHSVASAGDVNGDGFADLIVGAFGADPHGGLSGASYVVFGKASGFAANLDLSSLDGTNGFRLSGVAADDRSGRSVASAGDVNGDGFADLIVGAPLADPNGINYSGASYVIYGRLPDTAVNRTGTGVSQTLAGGNFDDTLSGLGGSDRLFGNGGNDVLDGGAGADILRGGAGDDSYEVDSAGDVVDEQHNSGAGTDVVLSSISFSLAASAHVLGALEQLTLTGAAAIDGTGNGLDNLIVGNVAANTLDGGVGSDALIGGGGNDIYVTDGSGDKVVEVSNQGTDTVRSSVSFTLGDNLENLTLTGAAAINGTGNGLDNLITGNAAANVLNGGSGADTLIGGGGNDTYVTAGGDTITEALNQGTDTVQSSVSFTLGANLENLTLTGAAAINGTGNALANVITGNAASNVLNGGALGDLMRGLGGNDIYMVDYAGDTVDESVASSAGIDTVQSSLISINFGDRVHYRGALENITLLGSAALGATGNSGVNVLNGSANSAANLLRGMGGNDVYIIGAGDRVGETLNQGTDTVRSSVTFTLGANLENLTLTGAAAVNGTGNTLNNSITGNAAANVLNGAAGGDTLNGGGANDTLIGGLGKDTMVGGAGNDIFRFDAALHSGIGANADIITDFDDSGNDTMNLAGVFGGVLTYRGTAAITGAGQLSISASGADVYVHVNVGGSFASDMDIRLANTTLASMTASDFFL